MYQAGKTSEVGTTELEWRDFRQGKRSTVCAIGEELDELVNG
jgi:hypothetical protein